MKQNFLDYWNKPDYTCTAIMKHLSVPVTGKEPHANTQSHGKKISWNDRDTRLLCTTHPKKAGEQAEPELGSAVLMFPLALFTVNPPYAVFGLAFLWGHCVCTSVHAFVRLANSSVCIRKPAGQVICVCACLSVFFFCACARMCVCVCAHPGADDPPHPGRLIHEL